MDMIITPEKGLHKEIGRQLLGLADHPRDVQWVTWPAAGYSVPLALYLQFEAEATGNPAELATELQPAAEPRKRGRPRKNPLPESTDNNDTSEEE